MAIHPDWKIKDDDIEGLSHIANVLSQPPEYYQKRIQKIGFLGKDTRLLDAACGSGIWAVAAAKLNKEVCGIDSSEKYLAVAREIKKNLKIVNCKLKIGKLERLPYPAEYFDYVICYNAWMYTHRQESIREMYRVMKPGGKIYLGCIAGFGYYLMLALEGIKKGHRSLIFTALRAIKDRVYMTVEESKKLLQEEDLKILKISPSPDFKLKKNWYVYEIIGEK